MILEEFVFGSYILCYEIIVLYFGGVEGLIQMYFQCINFVVEGSGIVEFEGVLVIEFYFFMDLGFLYNVFVDEWSDVEYIIFGFFVV